MIHGFLASAADSCGAQARRFLGLCMPEWISELFLKEPRYFGGCPEDSRINVRYALGKKPLARITSTALWRSSTSTCFMMR